jgi:hypothetical protein
LSISAIATSVRTSKGAAAKFKQLTQPELVRAPRKSHTFHPDDTSQGLEGDIHCQETLVVVLSVSVIRGWADWVRLRGRADPFVLTYNIQRMMGLLCNVPGVFKHVIDRRGSGSPRTAAREDDLYSLKGAKGVQLESAIY